MGTLRLALAPDRRDAPADDREDAREDDFEPLALEALFVDDDTYFCPDAPLADALESLFLRRGVSTPRAATPVRRLERLAITYVKASIDPARPRGERRRPNMRAPNRVDPN